MSVSDFLKGLVGRGQYSAMGHNCQPALRRLRRARALALGSCVASWGLMARAQSAPPACIADNVQVSGALDPLWTQTIAAACRRLGELPDRDPGASLALDQAPGGEGLRVRLDLADGRSAVRTARVPEELVRVMEALVTLPPQALQPEPSAEPPVAPPVAPSVPAVTQKPVSPASEALLLGFDAAVLATSRVLGPRATAAFGLAVTGDLNIDHGWIAGLRMVADLPRLDLENEGRPESINFGGGPEFARRIAVEDALAIDLGIGADGLVDAPLRGRGRDDDARGDLRLRTFGKLWASGQGLSFAASLGFEVSPIGLSSSEPRPAIGGELGLGIGWCGL